MADWDMIGIWRALTWVAVLDATITVALIIHAGASLEVIAIAVVACATGAAMMAALAFRARDRWLSH